ncbi:MAG: hypothetical protein K1X79_09385 [Oligoflexia bacterium]|nr:hypothetical protein [Oligoflexia bacterium]
MFSRNGTAVLVALTSLSGCGEKSQCSSDPEHRPPLTWKERFPRGYEDMGNGVFLIGEQSGYSTNRQEAQEQALANFLADNPNLSVTRKIKLNGPNEFGDMTEIVLWTEPVNPTDSTPYPEALERPDPGE